jgi:hypothetical protein
MLRKRLLVLGFVLSALSPLPAQDVVIEPPAPSSWSEESPAFMHFKKIVISPRDSGSFDFDITLHGELPVTFPKGRGASFTLSFDFAEIDPYKSVETNRIPFFNDDLSISINRYVGESKFQAYPRVLEYRKRNWDIKVSNLSARKDKITFGLRSPLFALHPPSVVVFRSNYWKATSPTQASGMMVQETTPVSPEPPAAAPVSK